MHLQLRSRVWKRLAVALTLSIPLSSVASPGGA